MGARVLGLAVVVACGGGSSDVGLTAHEGVYTVATWTRSTTGCEVEGPSVAESLPPHFFIKDESFFGRFINLNLCRSIDECTRDAQDDETLHIGQWGFNAGNDTEGWTDNSAFASKVDDDSCEATRIQTLMTFTGTAVRVEERSRFGTFAPIAGECPDDDAFLATETSPCEDFDVMTASFVAAF